MQLGKRRCRGRAAVDGAAQTNSPRSADRGSRSVGAHLAVVGPARGRACGAVDVEPAVRDVEGIAWGRSVPFGCQRSFKIPPPAVIENSPTPLNAAGTRGPRGAAGGGPRPVRRRPWRPRRGRRAGEDDVSGGPTAQVHCGRGGLPGHFGELPRDSTRPDSAFETLDGHPKPVNPSIASAGAQVAVEEAGAGPLALRLWTPAVAGESSTDGV